MRVGLRALLQSEPEIQVNGEFASLAELDDMTSEVDILLIASETGWSANEISMLDHLPERCGLLVLTNDASSASDLLIAWSSPTWGILSSDASSEELVAALNAVSQGLLTGSPGLLNQILQQPEPIVRPAREYLSELTTREQEVLQYLAQGLANKQIALTLGISEHTVKFHVSAIYSKLGASNRTEAVSLGLKQGLISL